MMTSPIWVLVYGKMPTVSIGLSKGSLDTKGAMKENDRIRAYAKQKGVPSNGMFKNGSTKKKLVEQLTPKQQRRLRKKQLAGA
jgi:hypothetical protein